MNIAPKPPLARQGQQLASHGRYGDTQLVHMNPYEVQGLAAMAPTGQLTKNPVTGQPEAFLPMLAPIIGSVVGKAALGKAIGSGLAGAIGSGLATWAQTGDFEKGVISGVTGFGLGKVLGAGTDAVNPEVKSALEGVDVAQANMADATKALGSQARPDLGSVMIGGNPVPGFTVGPEAAVTPFSPEQLDFVNTAGATQRAATALDAARQNVTAGDMLKSFTTNEGLGAMGKAALRPDALLPIAVGEGTQAQVAQQDAMAQMQKDNEREDAAYAQGFKDVLTDSLGMARGSEPNPYANFYSSGGMIPSYNGGGQLEAALFVDPLENAGIDATSGLKGYGLDEDSRYFIKPREGSAGERQRYLRGFEKLDPPTDYRHGFEEEFQFFDYIGDRDVPRELDTFGAGPSDYLAGLLAADLAKTNAPSAPNTSPLATYDTVRADQFSGVDNFGDYGVGDLPAAPDLPDITDTVVQGTLGGDAGGTDTLGGGTGDDTATGKDTGVTVDPTPDYIKALDALNIAKDGDYDRPEGESVYDVMQDYGATDQQIADYYGVDAAGVAEAADVIGGGRALADAGLTLGVADESGVVDYAQEEVDQVYDMLTAGDVSLAAAADYFQTSGDEILANMGAIADARKLDAEREAAQLENLSAYGSIPEIATQETINDLVDGIESNMFTVDQVAAQYGLEADAVQAEYDRIQGARDAEAALVAAAAANPVAAVPNLDFSAVDTSGMNIDPTAFYGDEGAATGGQVGKKRFMTRMGEVELAEGGLADVPVSEEFMQEVVVEEPTPEQMLGSAVGVEEARFGPDIDYNDLINMTVEAIKGNAENADEVINLFIEEFGTDKFQQLREVVLQSIVPDAQTEGMIAGDSGGMDDEVMGMIGEEQPVAVSPGEYIVAADVVSGLGDGNSDAGADVLDEMMQNVRNARSGGRQPSPIDKSAVMPA